jgi:formylglycine-generating enzyme required for sulfatase activity
MTARLSTAFASVLVMLAMFSTRGFAAEPETVVNSIGMKLVRVSAGEFVMGTEDARLIRADHPHSIEPEVEDEQPTLRVRISRPLDAGACEVTVGQFRAFVEATGYKTDAETRGGGRALDATARSEVDRFPQRRETDWRNPGFSQTDEHPVACVSWHDAVAFCQWLSKQEAAVYRLPTEAEWEYLCRAGTNTWYFCGNKPDDLYRYANVADAALYALHREIVLRQRVSGLEPPSGDGHAYTSPAGSYPANAFGLCDTHGRPRARLAEAGAAVGRSARSRADRPPPARRLARDPRRLVVRLADQQPQRAARLRRSPRRLQLHRFSRRAGGGYGVEMSHTNRMLWLHNTEESRGTRTACCKPCGFRAQFARMIHKHQRDEVWVCSLTVHKCRGKLRH